MDENQEKELKKEELPTQEKEVEQTVENPVQEKELQQPTEAQAQENKEGIQENQESKELIETNSKKKNKKPRKGNYIIGTIGAILGGAVAAIAWVVIYLFTEKHMVIPILGTLIPAGAYLGYKIFRGKRGKPISVIITIISLVFIVLVTTIICPSILLMESGYSITLENLLGLYSDVRADVREVIIADLIAGLIFTILGIVIVIVLGIKRSSAAQEQIKQFNQESKKDLKEKAEVIKKACQTLNAMSSENAVTKKAILKELKNSNKLKRKQRKKYFIMCKLAKILTKHKGKYYYDENDEENKIAQAPKINSKLKLRKFVKMLIKLLIIAAIITGIVVYYLFFVEKPYYVAGTNIELDISDIEYFYGTPEEITEAVGEEAAKYYEFIIDGKDKKYELYGQVIPKTQYEGKDFGTIIQEERDYYAPYLGEDVTSQVEDKQLGEDLLKSYNYTTIGTDGNKYRSIIYLYEAENSYLWINVYTYYEIEVTQIDSIVDKLIK